MADIHHHYPIISMVHSSINYLLNDYSPSEIQALANSDVVQVLVPEYIEVNYRRFCTKIILFAFPI